MRIFSPLLIGGLSLLMMGCGLDDTGNSACTPDGETRGGIVTFATFARQIDDDTAEGINLDDVVSHGNDVAGCYKTDFTSPAGVEGIDNQFATLLPIVEEQIGSENIDALLTAAIVNGQLLILMGVTGVDDPENDPCVDVLIGAGVGSPFLDTQGEYVPYQTFGFDRDSAPVSVLPGQIVNGRLTAGPGDFVLPVRILDADFNLKMFSGQVDIQITREPIHGGFALDGVVAGGIDVDDFKEIVHSLNIDQALIGAVLPIIAGKADLGRDSDDICRQVSAGLKIRAVPAFLLE
ncbi:hypothetical protein JYT22_00180 [Endomicrobium sp. AH-315-J14]|nr:hypothetical protein [Endomicrobium sp. AH-315-J14]